jgi:hypothetical protein
LVAITFCPLVVDSPLAVSGGYGVQLQLVPRGTESPSATIDQVRKAPVVVVEDGMVEEAVVDEDVAADSRDRLPHAVVTQQSTTKPASAKPSLRSSTLRV